MARCPVYRMSTSERFKSKSLGKRLTDMQRIASLSEGMNSNHRSDCEFVHVNNLNTSLAIKNAVKVPLKRESFFPFSIGVSCDWF